MTALLRSDSRTVRVLLALPRWLSFAIAPRIEAARVCNDFTSYVYVTWRV